MAILLEGDVFKGTASSNVVVERHVELHADAKFITYHDYKNEPSNIKTWYLDAKCVLEPKLDSEICQPVSRLVRPRGSWTITTRFFAEGERLDLFIFTIQWPSSWAPKGYTSFTFGWTTLEEAREWHCALAQMIAGVSTGGGLPPQLGTTSMPVDVACKPRPDATAASVTLKSITADDTMRSPALATASSAPEALPEPPPKATAAEPPQPPPLECLNLDPELSSLPAPTPGKQWRSLTERWVPYKQVNGLAIYHRADPGTRVPGLGGEFMVSTTIRGSPSDVLFSLMHGSSHTTILGPASVVQMLNTSSGKANSSSAVIRLVLEAPGWAGTLCAPREMLVQRLLKTEDAMHVVLFSSVEREPGECPPKELITQSGQPHKLHSLYRKPVQGKVRGNYVIAPLCGHDLHNSPETMITCILQVDLKGVCGDKSWFRPISDALGWTDAFLDRILMTVILVRDDVEHSRFRLEWQKYLGQTGAEEEPPATTVAAAGGSESQGAGRALGRMQSAQQRSFNRTDTGSGGALKRPDVAEDIMSQIHESPEEASDSFHDLTEKAPLPQGVIVDLNVIKSKCTLDPKYWEQIHAPGAKAFPYMVRGPTYLKDRKKIPAGNCAFTFASMDMVVLPEAVEHVARFLPSIRQSGAPFSIVINLIIPGTPLLGLVATFITERHPNEALGSEPPANPMSDNHDWEPFDFVLHKFVNGSDATRNQMLKLIPHIANGSWVIRQSVGVTPVIVGKALRTTYHQTSQYLEIDIDISANSTANYITGMVRGATTGLVIDMGFVLEGTSLWELPECLLGAIRLNHLDTSKAQPLDTSKEIPLVPPLHTETEATGGV